MTAPSPAPQTRAAKQYARHQKMRDGRCNCASCVTYRIDNGLADDTDREQRAAWDRLKPRQAAVRTEP